MHIFRYICQVLTITLLIIFSVMLCYAEQLTPPYQEELSLKQQNQKLFLVTALGVGAITAWGVIQWDYFSQSPHSTSEGWFSNDTKYGGSDKLGHMYISYVSTHGLAYLYEKWSFPKEKAALYGALSSLLILGYTQ